MASWDAMVILLGLSVASTVTKGTIVVLGRRQDGAKRTGHGQETIWNVQVR